MNKPVLLLFMTLLSGSFKVTAHDTVMETKPVRIFTQSVEGGPTISNIYCSDYSADCFTPVVGGYAGLMFDYFFHKHFSVGSGIAWERKGTLFKTSYSDPVNYYVLVDYFFTFDYFTLPFLIKARFGNKVKFLVSAGPYFSVLVSQTYTNNNEGTYGGQVISPETYTRSLPYDIGFTGSLGVEFCLWKDMSLNISACDHVGLINTQLFPMIRTPGATYGSNPKSYLNSVILSFGLKWYFGKQKGQK
ncbi:MAG: porin family protein [Bacteroidota bacterium]|jgi:Outer membrane protein beta-barrel domain